MSERPNVIVIPATQRESNNTKRENQKLLRVAAYCRVSTDEEEQLGSYEAQKAYYTEKIMTNPDWVMAEIFADEGITGTSAAKRSGFQKMIRNCRKGKVDLVLTKSISRFARNTLECLEYVRELRELGIAVIFEKENINTLDMNSEMILTMHGAFAQAESESIRQNVKWGVRQSMREGKVSFQYSKIFGYERGEDGRPQIVQEQAKIILRIFPAYLDGMSVKAIKNMLEKEGIPAPMGGQTWSVAVLQHLLQNEKYCGDALLQKSFVSDVISRKIIKNTGQLPMYLIQDNHEGIIDRQTFLAVQAEIARRAGTRSKSDNTITGLSRYNSKYALTEIVFCGECGKPYRRCTWRKNEKTRIVWRCINRVEHGTKYCKASPTVDEDKLQEAVLSAIRTRYGATNAIESASQTTSITITLKAAKQLMDGASALLFLVAAGQPDDYDRQMRFVQQRIVEMKHGITAPPVAVSMASKSENQLVTDRWDEVTVRKTVERVVVRGKTSFEIGLKDL